MAASNELRRYLQESARPWPSLLFVAPMLLAYEVGILLLGPAAPRNGADIWLRGMLGQVGFGQHFVLPLLTIALLLGWHYMRREQWRVAWPVFSGMAVESALLGLLLLLAANSMSSWAAAPAASQAGVGDSSSVAGQVVAYLGAGIYEELLFRLLMLSALAAMLKSVGLRGWSSLAVSGALTSLVFALAHYELDLSLLGGSLRLPGETFDPLTFSFRALAGAFFSALFVLRGFGIAAGAHALYDIFVALL